MSPPGIKLQGIRVPIPPGYILGRTSPGTGVVELIKIADLGKALVVAGQGSTLGVAGRAAIPVVPSKSYVEYLGFQAPGPFTATQQALQLGGAAFSQGEEDDGQEGMPGPPGPSGVVGNMLYLILTAGAYP